MIEDRRRSTSKPRNWTRFAALLAVFALSFLTIRQLAGRSAGGDYPTPPFFHLFFSDTYFAYYHRARTHLSLQKDAPDIRPIERPEAGMVVQIPEVGGLHHRYLRQAA